jgi:hypothetical protein
MGNAHRIEYKTHTAQLGQQMDAGPNDIHRDLMRRAQEQQELPSEYYGYPTDQEVRYGWCVWLALFLLITICIVLT